MWPFSSKKPVPVPSLRVGNFRAWWDPEVECWEFTDGTYDYSTSGSPEFDVVIFDEVNSVKRWLEALEEQINVEIKKRLAGWCEWSGKKHVVSINVSKLISDGEVHVSYAGDDDEWGDIIVVIFAQDGLIVDSTSDD